MRQALFQVIASSWMVFLVCMECISWHSAAVAQFDVSVTDALSLTTSIESLHVAEEVPLADEPDVWAVSTRRLGPTCRVPLDLHVSVDRLGPSSSGVRRWERADLESLLAPGQPPLVIFIHGNRYDAAAAKTQANQLACRLTAFRAGAEQVQTAVFSWPSEKQGFLLADGRAKYERCYTEARYLAALLGRIEPDRPVAIIAYSFGALITLEALEDLCGDEDSPPPHGLHSPRERTAATHVVLIAPAVRSDSLAPRGPYRDALECIDRMTVIINSRDDVLRFFPLLDRAIDLPALGFVGMPRQWIPTSVGFLLTDASPIVGKHHGLTRYLESSSLSRRITDGAIDGL